MTWARRTSPISVALLLASTVGACTSSTPSSSEEHSTTQSTSTTSVSTSTVPDPTRAECTADPSHAPGVDGLQEIGGPGLYGLLFAEYPIRKRTEAKIAWRVTGSGQANIAAWGPSGRFLKPLWGPEVHTGSNWDRPGTEWGTGFRFPSAGCWQVVATTDDGTQTVAVQVV